jgi:transcriptional regulator with XRE-family HTH domain
MVPLPCDRRQPESTLPKQHRFRALDVALAASIQLFRTEHDLTLAEVASAVGAANQSAVSQWENGINVPSGVRKRRLIDLLAGKNWKSLRAKGIEEDGLRTRWRQAVRWTVARRERSAIAERSVR